MSESLVTDVVSRVEAAPPFPIAPLEVRGPAGGELAEILSPEALAFLARLVAEALVDLRGASIQDLPSRDQVALRLGRIRDLE